ncbi:hypothetical protein Fmac_014789 [Flemingia macrophylla]|uniref:Uncharacterized protein n=1 Tax=Flemingia macrophylla TaxID=520843 RepID=A0ABD1MCS0_9FABA
MEQMLTTIYVEQYITTCRRTPSNKKSQVHATSLIWRLVCMQCMNTESEE